MACFILNSWFYEDIKGLLNFNVVIVVSGVSSTSDGMVSAGNYGNCEGVCVCVCSHRNQ